MTAREKARKQTVSLVPTLPRGNAAIDAPASRNMARLPNSLCEGLPTPHTSRPKVSTPKPKRSRLGYIMVETLVAMVILSISSMYIHRSVYQAVTARREAQKLTISRHLLEHVIAKIEMRPDLVLSADGGTFADDGYPQYGYQYEVTTVDAPIRGPAARYLTDDRMTMRYQDYIGKLSVIIYENTDGPQNPLCTGETLLRPGQVWLPEADR